MNRTQVIRLIASSIVGASLGCGGGGGSPGGSGDTQVHVELAWAEKSRAISGPASALSMTLVLQGAAVPSGNFSFTANWDGNPAAHSVIYTSSTRARPGSWPLVATFYAGWDGTGDIVGTANATITLDSSGQINGSISTDGRVASIEVIPGQVVVVGLSRQLLFTVRDSSNAILAVSQRAPLWQVLSGSAFLQFNQGFAHGLSVGTASVTANLDGVVSAPTDVSVEVIIPAPRIAFRSDRVLFNGYLWMIRSDYSELTHFSNPNAGYVEQVPVFSPDGSKIAFERRISGDSLIGIMNADGTGRVELTLSAQEPRDSTDPAFSADGQWICFSTHRDSGAGIAIWKMRTDGSQKTQLIGGSGVFYAHPTFTPDGRIVFIRSLTTEICIMDSDGTNVQVLVPGDPQVWLDEPCVSPDGTTIAFTYNVSGQIQIAAVDIDGSDFRLLTNTGIHNWSPSFSPDSSKIAFTSTRDGNYEIYTMNADGSNVKRMTSDPARDEHPSFGPP